MDRAKTLDQRLLKRCFQTRRFTGRRGITPMKSKHKKAVPKTRGHKVGKRPYVPIRKHSVSQQYEQWKDTDTEEHCKDKERKGAEDSC